MNNFLLVRADQTRKGDTVLFAGRRLPLTRHQTMPADSLLVRADQTREGDTVRFAMPSAGYTVEELDTDAQGRIRHRAKGGTVTCSYMPGESIWIAPR